MISWTYLHCGCKLVFVGYIISSALPWVPLFVSQTNVIWISLQYTKHKSDRNLARRQPKNELMHGNSDSVVSILPYIRIFWIRESLYQLQFYWGLREVCPSTCFRWTTDVPKYRHERISIITLIWFRCYWIIIAFYCWSWQKHQHWWEFSGGSSR